MKKSPILAAVLNLFFGVGYIYLGKWGRLLVYWLAMLAVVNFLDSNTLVGFVVIVFAVLDGYDQAKKMS